MRLNGIEGRTKIDKHCPGIGSLFIKVRRNMIHLLPKYRQIIKREKPTEVQVTKWSAERVEVLRGCFDITDWSVFQSDNGNYDIEAITGYINFYVDCHIPSKTVKCYPNNKTWVTKI